MTSRELNFLTSQTDILKALLQSKETATSISIRSNVLGGEAIISCVQDIIFEDGQTIIVLKPYDTTGYMLPLHKINLVDIQGVYPFSTPFNNPFLENLDKGKSWNF